MKQRIIKYTFSVLLCAGMMMNANASAPASLSNDSVVSLARKAYVYGLPLVLTDLTRIGSGAPPNRFFHRNKFPDHTDRLVVRPNNDTFYSSAFLDLGAEPVVITTPESSGRYYVVPLMDAWTNVFESFGTRTTGTHAQTYVITGPRWKGNLPAGIREVKSPTDEVWIIGRIQVNNPEDGKTFVTNLQKELTTAPLSIWNKSTNPVQYQPTRYSIENLPLIDSLRQRKLTVVDVVNRLDIETYFSYLNELLVKNPPLPADAPLVKELAKIGIDPNGKFALSNYDEKTQNTLKGLNKAIFSEFAKVNFLVRSQVDTKPDLTIGRYGTDYLKRAAVALFGLGALPAEEAAYPSYARDSQGQPLTGKNNYHIHFEAGKLPPAQAFWSLTLYDKDGYLADNPIRRYAIGDRDKLSFNPDGSLDIYIQHNNPGIEKESNWLPAPDDVFSLSLRIYLPTNDYLHKEGAWVKPPIERY